MNQIKMIENLPNISIIIVNWNSSNYLYNCLRSIKENVKSLTYEIIVIDNASFDGCEEMLRKDFPETIFIQSQNNLGFAAANNLAANEAKGNIFLFINPDTIMMEGCLKRMINNFFELPKAGVTGPRVLNSDGTLQISCVQVDKTPLNQALDSNIFRRLFSKTKLWGNYKAFLSQEPIEVDAVSGVCMLVRRDIFQKIGGFREEYFMYGEDIDLCLRVRKLGYKVYHIPNAEIIHYGGSSSSQRSNKWSIVMLRVAGETYMKLNKGIFSAFLYRFLQGLSAIIRLIILILLILFVNPIHKNHIISSIKKWYYVLLWAIGISLVQISKNRKIRNDIKI